MAWYRQWFGEEYLELYAHRDVGEAEANIDWVESLFGDSRPRAILDLACGAGRHTEALRSRGHRALGVDLSLTLLARNAALPRVAGDMLSLPFADAAFDWVLNFFTSFGYFEREPDNFRVLQEVARVLEPRGRFVLDLFNLDRVLEGLVPREETERNGRLIQIERWFDAEARRVNKRIRVRDGDGPERTFLESVRAYRKAEVVCGLEWAGFEVDALYGSFKGEPFDRDSPRLILLCTKRA